MVGSNLAEREGFEPSVEFSPHTRLAGERLQPARPSLQNFITKIISSDYQIGGGSRIRTYGALTLNGFQDRRFKPLSHPSLFHQRQNINCIFNFNYTPTINVLIVGNK